MPKEIYWLDGAWTGKLGVAPRPRGGDWLKDDISNWKRAHIDTVLSLLTPDEERDLDLRDEAVVVRAQGMNFASFPIPDRQIPTSETKWSEALEKVSRDLSAGKTVLVHCRQGIGRSSLLSAALLTFMGEDLDRALQSIGKARGLEVPETVEQRRWLDQFAKTHESQSLARRSR